MRIRSPSLHELHAFASTARLGSFSKAADELCVTQGAVSRAVARLEEHLSVRLLDRYGRLSTLTDAGRAYLDNVAPALQQLEFAAESAGAHSGAHTLRLSVPPTLATKWLIPRLPDFRALHPEVAISFAPYRRDDPLDTPDIDGWIRVRRGDAPWHPPHIQADYLVGREIVPICRPGDMHGRLALRTPEDLLQRPLLFHTNYPDNWRLWFDTQGVRDAHPKPAADFDQVAMLLQGVISGLGLAVVQRCLIEDELAAGRVAIPIDKIALTPRGYYVCAPKGKRETRGMRVFRDWVLTQATDAAGSLQAQAPAS
ncbi:LysR substrate-binding domain-containing protein [Variovorax sp. PAMC26660]|uniref:LysR substrate-binding domain-containing protein n=1 Tax=Variovorax sp. PAMC26660 TaxID=2762322 RepID=UPI00164E1C43|nr:LysR substrate-binding domain-containing protein [Variovorax sp. PAMC26660]QNK67331.1 LysR family transcriptional regulator [Variovorax sp. PAMC26660]